jgi:hypothetical protein
MYLNLESIVYLVAGVVIILLFVKRRKVLAQLSPEDFPELEKPLFLELKRILDTSYERSLYLGYVFLILFFINITGWGLQFKGGLFLLVLVLFIFNIIPRNKIVRLLDAAGLELDILKKKGIRF